MSNIHNTGIPPKLPSKPTDLSQYNTKIQEKSLKTNSPTYHNSQNDIANFKSQKEPHKLISERSIVTSFKNVIESLKNFFKPTPKSGTGEMPVLIKIQTKEGEIILDRKILPKSGLSDDTLKGVIGRKIDNGRKILDDIYNGKLDDKKPSSSDVADLMWFLKVKAEEKNGAHISGAIMIDDPGKKIAQYLNRHNEQYVRMSTHLQNFQKSEEGVHHGIDFNYNIKSSTPEMEDIAKMLPHGKRTLLYGSLPKDIDGNPKDMIFLKMEYHGSAAFKNKTDIAKNLESRQLNRHDIGHAFGHAFTFLQSIYYKITGKKPESNARKEHIPSHIKKDFNQLLKNLSKSSSDSGNNTFNDLLNKNTTLKSGIRTIYTNSRTALCLSLNIKLENAKKQAQSTVKLIQEGGELGDDATVIRKAFFKKEDLPSAILEKISKDDSYLMKYSNYIELLQKGLSLADNIESIQKNIEKYEFTDSEKSNASTNSKFNTPIGETNEKILMSVIDNINANYNDNLDVRLGNEVIFTQNELLSSSKN